MPLAQGSRTTQFNIVTVADSRSSLQFDCQFAYDDRFMLSLEFRAEAPITALVGPSGSGKTTVLSLIAGLLRPATDSIALADEVWVDSEQRVFREPPERRVGLMMQQPFLFPHLSVQRNVWFGARRRGITAEFVQHVIDVCEIERLLNRLLHQLSGGQAQRVALARALSSNPRLLLLDEPLSSVEEALQVNIGEFIRRVSKEFQVPILLASHQSALIAQLADDVVEIRAGKIGRASPSE